MSGLPREVIKWLQSLDLAFPVKNVKRDFSNGYLVAEILAHYNPHEIQMHSFSNGTSIQTKLGNWQQIEKFFEKHAMDVPKKLTEATIHCKPGAAHALLEKLYTLLTNQTLHYLPAKTHPQDFSDTSYQLRLPHYARSTAAQSIKTNLQNTEIVMEPDRITCGLKAEAIMKVHGETKKIVKGDHPDRFGIKRGRPGKVMGEGAKEMENESASFKEVKVEQKMPSQLS